MTPSWRLFFAVLPPEHVQAKVARLRRKTKGLRWVKQANVHITITFLGSTPVELAQQMEADLAPLVASLPAPALRTDAVGYFSRRKPRVLWVGVTGQVERLRTIKKTVDERLAAAPYTITPETRAYTPHLTVARSKTVQGGRTIREIANRRHTIDAAWQVDAIHLMRSDLTPQGSIYTSVAVLPLSM